jgi:aspartate carbamoyltransferase regulatory subunit
MNMMRCDELQWSMLDSKDFLSLIDKITTCEYTQFISKEKFKAFKFVQFSIICKYCDTTLKRGVNVCKHNSVFYSR